MSQQTLDALEAALTEHLKDEDDTDLVVHWVIVSSGITLDDSEEDKVMMTTPLTQARYVTIGLLEASQIMLRAITYDAVLNSDEDFE
jgi:aspartyl-tRNA synthetase